MIKLGQRLLWRRAHNYLQRHKPTLVGIGGSRGQSMVKDALRLTLAERHVQAASFSYRQRLDVALSILGAGPEPDQNWLRLLTSSALREINQPKPDIILLELGANTPGEIDYFARTLPLSVVVVTNVHSRNLHLFNNLDLLAHEQTSLVASLKREQVACLNHDDPRVAEMAQYTKAQIIWFGSSHGDDVRLARLNRLSSLGYACEFNVRGTPLEIHLPNIIAKYQLANVGAALAATLALKGNVKSAARSLSSLQTPPGQVRLLSGERRSKIIDDTHDSTPESLIAALAMLSELPARRRVAVLGDIVNLGAHTVSWHEEIGRAASEVANIIILVGDNMRSAGAVALATAQQLHRAVDVHHFNDSPSAAQWLSGFIKSEDLVYVAGSRALKMEEVVKALLANPTSVPAQ